MKHKNIITVGLDIGSYAIKCAGLSRTLDGYRLEFAKVFPSTTGVIRQVSEFLKKSKEVCPGIQNIRVSVSGPSVVIRRIQLPVMTAEELKSAIRFQAESHIPFPVDDCILDSQILDQNAADGNMNVLLVAAKKDFITQKLNELSAEGIKPHVIDSEIFCVLNAYETFGNVSSEKTYGILHVGHEISSFAIMHEGILHFIREITHGGLEVTRAIASLKVVSEEEAATVKHDSGSGSELRPAIQTGLGPLFGELEQSINFFQQSSSSELKTIHVSGGGALAEEACAVLTDYLGIRFALWDYETKLELSGSVESQSFKLHRPQFAAALGLAVR